MSPGIRRLLAALGGFTATGVLALSAFAGASAAGATPVSAGALAPSYVETHALARSTAQVAAVEAYWKPERLKSANDFPPRTADPKPGGSRSSAAHGAAQAVPTATAAATGQWTVRPAQASQSAQEARGGKKASGGAVAQAPKTVGKVFFRIGTQEYWCSASAVRAKNRSLVATAAHCAFDVRSGRPVQDWIFVPNYRKGEQPDGIYVGHTLVVHGKYAWEGDYDYDYAFVAVHPGFKWQAQKDAKGTISYHRVSVGRLQDNVGGQGITVNRGTTVQAVALGYPAGPQPGGSRPYDGHSLKSCSGTTRKVTAPTYRLDRGIAIKGCDFTAGASGGPWLVQYDPAKGIGYLNGINSLSWNRVPDGKNDEISSPYFDHTTQNVYNRAQSIPTG